MRTSAFVGAKNFGFSKFIVCQLGQEGLGQCEPFADKRREGVNFRDFVQTSFTDGP